VLLSDLFGTFDKKDPGRSSSKPAGNSKVDGFDSDSLSEMEGDESEAENYSDGDGDSRLLKAVERFSKYNRDEQKSNMKSMISESFGENFSRGLSMNALLGDLDENKGLSRVKEQLSDIGKKAAPVSVDKVVAERIERQQTYEVNKSDINKWHETVLMNRHVRTLNLANDKRELSKSRTLLNTFAPTTSLEKEISMVTFDTGITEKELEEKEMENLKGRNLSLEEIKQRQAELSKINALMFYEQMKRHRINKIKSKAYRAVQRRKRAKTEGDEVLEEKQAEERARERASLRHKNTSNWARMALEFGHTDKDLRY
jgi:U3 small nucleolar RNA-associated protein 14